MMISLSKARTAFRVYLPAVYMPAALYLISGIVVLRHYLLWTSVNFLIGLLVLPLLLRRADSRTGLAYGCMAIVLAVITFALPVQTAYYAAICCAVLCCLMQWGFRPDGLMVPVLLLMSPVSQYFASVFSFPVRLWLTDIAGRMLLCAGIDVTIAGNTISSGAVDFAVDPACMGLNMLVTSMLCGILILAVRRRQYGLQLSPILTALYLLLLFALNVLANLVRIVLLVWLRLLPEHPMHGISGIICLVVYVLLPAAFFARLLLRHAGRTQPLTPAPRVMSRTIWPALHYLMVPCLFLAGWKLIHRPDPSGLSARNAYPGYTATPFRDDVVKLENGRSLIYLKPTHGFIHTDHNPLLCWTGCGYTFARLEEQNWSGLPIFTGILRKGAEQLYTAWWYDNGVCQTTSQLQWRWQMIKGAAPFTIINVTASDRATLIEEVHRFRDKRKTAGR